MSFGYDWAVAVCNCTRLSVDGRDETSEVADRQDRLDSFSTASLATKRVLLIGAGGLGGHIAVGHARKGIGRLDICDPDVVELSNLNRQVFYEKDLFRPKAHRLAWNASREGFLGGTVVGHHVAFDDETAETLTGGVDLVVCAVDNNATRAAAVRHCRRENLPALFTATDESASYVWVFAQEPNGPCLACVFPRVAEPQPSRQPCQPVPAVLDVLYVAAGLVLRAADMFLQERSLPWNYCSLHFTSGSEPVDRVLPRVGCTLCGVERCEKETTTCR